jgi:hypothetical protein
MNLPKTKYARSGDVRIAYQITGGGPFDVVWAPGTLSASASSAVSFALINAAPAFPIVTRR